MYLWSTLLGTLSCEGRESYCVLLLWRRLVVSVVIIDSTVQGLALLGALPLKTDGAVVIWGDFGDEETRRQCLFTEQWCIGGLL